MFNFLQDQGDRQHCCGGVLVYVAQAILPIKGHGKK
jgi:hypothetical protein